MQELIKDSYKISLVQSIFFIVIGLLLFINPASFVVSVSYLLGIFLLVYGVVNIIKYTQSKELSLSKVFLVIGIILSLAGLFLIIKPTFIGSIVPCVIGVCLIMNSIEKLMYLKFYLDKNSENYIISLISAIVALSAGVFLLFNPLSGTLIVTQIIGVIIVIYAVMDLIEKLRYKNVVNPKQKKIDKEIKIVDEKK